MPGLHSIHWYSSLQEVWVIASPNKSSSNGGPVGLVFLYVLVDQEGRLAYAHHQDRGSLGGLWDQADLDDLADQLTPSSPFAPFSPLSCKSHTVVLVQLTAS